MSEHFCPDGLVFDESSTSYAKCGFPFSIDCTGEEQSGQRTTGDNLRQSRAVSSQSYSPGRSDLQPAQPSHGCPRQHGYFTVPDERVREYYIMIPYIR